jgi:hypothetical protein
MLGSSETRELPHRKCLDSLSTRANMFSFKLHVPKARKKKESDNVAQASYQVGYYLMLALGVSLMYATILLQCKHARD